MITAQTQSFLDRLHRGQRDGEAWARFAQADGFAFTDKETGELRDSLRSTWGKAGKPFTMPKPFWDRNVWYGVNPSMFERTPYQGSTNATIAAINVLFAEFDGKDETNPTSEEIDAQFQLLRADPAKAQSTDKALRNEAVGHAKDAKFATNPVHYIDLARSRVMTLQPAPSVIVFSGGGFQCYWLLRSTVYFEYAPGGTPDRERFKDIQKRWVNFVGGDPGAHDLRRVLRLPGTQNRKPKYAPDYPTVSFIKCDLSLEYDLDQLIALMPPPVVKEPHTGRSYSNQNGQPSPTIQASDYDDQESVIAAYNKSVTYSKALDTYGYTHAGGDRWSRPGEPESKGVEVYEDDNSALHWSSNDPMFSEHRRRPFDLFCTFEHSGNVGRAVRAAAVILGMEWPDIDWPALALWGRTTRFYDLYPEAQRPAVYRTDTTETKVFDAIISEMAKYKRPKLFTSTYRLATLSGVSPNTVMNCLGRMYGVLFTFEKVEGGIVVRLVKWLMNEFRIAQIAHQEENADLFTAQSTRNEIPNEYTPRKATDPFLSGTSHRVKNRCIKESIASGLTLPEILATVPAGFGETGCRVLDAINRCGEMTAQEIADETGKSKAAIWRSCRYLENMGLLESTRETSRSPKVYSLAPDVWKRLEMWTPNLRTYGKQAEREEQQIHNAQVYAKMKEDIAEHRGDDQAAAKARAWFGILTDKRIVALGKRYPEMSPRDRILLAKDVSRPKRPHPSTEYKHRMEEAEERNRERWRSTETVEALRREGLGKKDAARTLEFAGWTANEAWSAVNRVWGAYQGVTI